jgi:hypothetical protein
MTAPSEAAMARKVILLAGLGFLTLLLIGPVLAVVATAVAVVAAVLPFILLGLAVWFPLQRWLCGRRPPSWHRLPRVKAAWQRTAGAVRRHGSQVGDTLRASGRTVAAFSLEVLSGAALGALLGLLRSPEGSVSALAILAGAGLGALVGVLVALARVRAWRRAEEGCS